MKKTTSFMASAARRLDRVPKSTVWTEFTPLGQKYKAVNLGQGFPSFSPPKFILENASKSFEEAAQNPLWHQYCRSQGHPDLVKVLQEQYTESLGRQVLDTEIVVTNGTTQGLNLAVQALVSDGDDVVAIEPFFDLYCNDVFMANGNVNIVPMHIEGPNANDWKIREEDLRAAITPKTKCMLLNTPQNVPGKVWSREELEMIAKVCIEKNITVIADEVYDQIAFDGCPHVSIASLPGMFERTVTLSSASKTFSATGWKIGWAVAPASITIPMQQTQAHQSFCVCTPLQVAVARSLVDAKTNGYYKEFNDMYLAKRKKLVDVLEAAGLPPVMPQGSFFILADITKVKESHYMDANEKEVGRDWQFCRWLCKEIGVTAIPTTAFCTTEGRSYLDKYARFAFCKDDSDIEEAGKRLMRLKEFF